MGRNINHGSGSKAALEGVVQEHPDQKDNYTAQIVKLIPTEIVGVYLGLQNFVTSLDAPVRFTMQLIFFFILLVIALPYLKNVAGVTDSKQRIVSIISYCIWGISLGGPFEYLLTKYHSPVSAQIIGGSLIMVYTLIVPLIYKKQNA